MNTDRAVRFSLPEASWATLKKILRAYYAKRGMDAVTVQEVAQAAGLHRPLVSANNNFLRAVGVLEQDSYKLTPLGTELGAGIARDDQQTERRALQHLVANCPSLQALVDIVEARGELSTGAFRTQQHLVLDVDEKDRKARFLGTISDLLVESGVITIEGDSVRPARAERGPVPPPMRVGTGPAPRDLTGGEAEPGFRRIPVPVSPGSLWYIEVPESPNPDDVTKFLEMQRLIFSVK